MALQKVPVPVNFARGIDTKSDPFQLQLDTFSNLRNSVFDTTNRLTKRNGYDIITTLPNDEQTTVTTLNDNLIATGSNLYAFSQDTNQWLNQGSVQPVGLEVQPLVRVSTSQSSPDTAIADNGLTCLVYIDTAVAYYQLSDSSTGQQVVARTAIGSTAAAPRVFILGRYFIITFLQTVSASTHLRYIAVPISAPASPLTVQDISTSVVSLSAGYDGYVANDTFYISWAGASTTIKTAYITSTLTVSPAVSIASHTASLISVTADTSGSSAIVWVTFYDSGGPTIYTAAYNHILGVVLAATLVNTPTINEITSVATAGTLTLFYETANTYSFSPNAKTDLITSQAVSQAGTVAGSSVVLRSVGLASKAFFSETGAIYMLATYGETNQPTYFLIDSVGHIYMRLAYANGGGYEATQVLPSVTLSDGTYYCPYLIKDFLASVNKSVLNGQALPAGTPVNAIYTQTGINLAKFTINSEGQDSSEIAGALHLTGGQVWEYDGVRPVEHGFHVWPENVVVTTATGAGLITAQQYYYAFTYEWTDNAGNLHRSAPSIPVSITTTTSTSTNTCKVPTLRLTDKISPNPVRIVGYRWSTAQPVFYQFTSLTSPTANSTTTDSVTITDALADSSILGNTLLYTTGGVIENIAAPAATDSALFKNRLWLIDAEDPNLLWYSKQVISNVPVEFSDLLTQYVAPTTGAQGSTGPMKAIFSMDDKFVIFKKDAIYYFTGNGPDNTGANNDFGDPTYIAGSVGSDNPNSLALTPNGIMFQSDKGIWLLGRDLSTTYIGAPVEAYNNDRVKSATVIPGTNQVRFVLDSGITLMYDYYYNQWGTFSNIRAISATLYQGLYTYLNSAGQVFQESVGSYQDGAQPVLMSLTTAWINLAGLQGFERFYFLYLLGKYFTPFKLNVEIAYNYNPSPVQSVLITPDNYSAPWGDEANWGSGPAWGGGPGNVFSAMLFPEIQKCQSFQLTITEVYDSSLGVPAGQGLSLSGMNMIIGVKKGYRTQKASRSFG